MCFEAKLIIKYFLTYFFFIIKITHIDFKGPK